MINLMMMIRGNNCLCSQILPYTQSVQSIICFGPFPSHACIEKVYFTLYSDQEHIIISDMSTCTYLYTNTLVLVCCYFNRAQLEKAKQEKEDAEREKKELADRLKKYEKDTKKAEEGKSHCNTYIQ